MLLQSESIEGVGGAAVFVQSSREGFCYSGYAGVYSPGPITLGRRGVSRPDPAHHPDYRYRFFAPEDAGIPAGALYLEQPRIGFFYHPLESDEPIRIGPIEKSELVDRIRTDYRIQLRSN